MSFIVQICSKCGKFIRNEYELQGHIVMCGHEMLETKELKRKKKQEKSK